MIRTLTYGLSLLKSGNFIKGKYKCYDGNIYPNELAILFYLKLKCLYVEESVSEVKFL